MISIGSEHSVDILNSPSQACIHRCDKWMSDWTGTTPFIPVVKFTMIRYLKDPFFAFSKFQKKKAHAILLLKTDFFFLLCWVVDLAAWQERQSAWNGKWPWRRCCSSSDLFKLSQNSWMLWRLFWRNGCISCAFAYTGWVYSIIKQVKLTVSEEVVKSFLGVRRSAQ